MLHDDIIPRVVVSTADILMNQVIILLLPSFLLHPSRRLPLFELFLCHHLVAATAADNDVVDYTSPALLGRQTQFKIKNQFQYRILHVFTYKNLLFESEVYLWEPTPTAMTNSV